MSSLEEYTLVIGGCQGGLLFLLLTFDRRLSPASRVLGLLCLVMALAMAMQFLRSAESGWALWVAGWVFYTPAAAGALGYLYCRGALLNEPLRRDDWRLFLPLFACYVLVADYLLADPRTLLIWINGADVGDWRPPLTEYIVFAQAVGYAVVTVTMIWRYRRQAAESLSAYNPAIFRWMFALQVFSIVIWTLNALPALSTAPIIYAQIANLLMVVLVYAIGIAQWRSPTLFEIPRLSSESVIAGEMEAVSMAENESHAEGELREALFASIAEAVENEALYLNASLTLTDLANATGLSRHQVSEALNKHAGKNFYEFINGYRVQAVCDRFLEDSDSTILTIAMDTGFSSKSTFNAIFKQFKGVTPSVYRRDMAQAVDGGKAGRNS